MKQDIDREKINILKSLWTSLCTFGYISWTYNEMTCFRNIDSWYVNIIDTPFGYAKIKHTKIIKDELSRTLNSNTTLTCNIDSLYLVGSKIDWKVFTKCKILFPIKIGHYDTKYEIYDLKDIPDNFDNILKAYQQRYTSDLCRIELTMPLDYDYIISKIKRNNTYHH